MATNTGEKDARRRRLKERGTDRLALITGKIQTLPSPSPSTGGEYHHSHTASCPPIIPDDFDQISSVSDSSETRDCHPPLPKHNSNPEGAFTRSKTEVYRASDNSEPDDKIIYPTVSTPTPQQKFHNPTNNKIFTTNQIIYAIAVSEITRIYFALFTAILVVLSYVGFPIVSSLLVFSKPVYLVLLTNMTIVLARIVLHKQSGVVYREEREVGSDGGSDLAGQVGMALESGFLLQNIFGAIFMDTSVYAVVVISGISLAQSLGW
jgi:hypothetical protein